MCYTFTLKKTHVNDRRLPSASTIEGLECIDVGKSGNVYALDARRVVKRYEGDIDAEIRAEREVYERLGRHPNIAEFLGALDDGSIILERGQVLRDRLLAEQQQTSARSMIPLRTKYRWVKQAATGLQHLHDHNIIQADVGCRNMIIAHRDGNLKLIDFEGCSIDGKGPNSSYEWFSYKPSTPRATVQTDIFALGCAIYEIVTGSHPHCELKGFKDAQERVERLYESNQFPQVAHLPMGAIMLDCWQGKFKSMREIVESIELLSHGQSTTKSRQSTACNPAKMDPDRWAKDNALSEDIEGISLGSGYMVHNDPGASPNTGCNSDRYTCTKPKPLTRPQLHKRPVVSHL